MQVPAIQSPMNNQRSFIPPPRPLFDTGQKLPGRFVSCEDDISLQEIPMDGSISYFPTQDLSKIFIRQWNKQGKLEGLTYILHQPESPNLPPPPPPVRGQQGQDGNGDSTVQREDPLTAALNGLNQGLANTFSQFSSTLQAMQQSMDNMSNRISSIMNPPDDGGMG